MPLYRYYISASPGDPSPRDDGLSSIDAKSAVDAVTILRRNGRLPANWQSLWIHFLVWNDPNGQQCGFESMPLSRFDSAN